MNSLAPAADPQLGEVSRPFQPGSVVLSVNGQTGDVVITALPLVTRTTLVEAATLDLVLGSDQDSTASGTLSAITFSGQPSYTQLPTVLRLLVTSGPHTLTIPTSWRIGETGSTTTVILGNGNHELSWVYADSKYWLADTASDNDTIPDQTGHSGEFLSTNGTSLSWAATTSAFSDLTGIPTTIAGYGITDFNSLGDARWSVLAHTHTFSSLTSKPTTLSGYGITDAQPLDSDLTAIAALSTTSFGRGLLPLSDAAAVRSYIGAGASSFSGAYTDLDFTGASIGSILGTVTVRGIQKEIWISVRSDGKGLLADTSAGTAENPFDGSTKAKIAAIHAAMATNTTVHFDGAGPFDLSNTTPKAGCIYVGSGSSVTTLKTTTDDGSTHYSAVFNTGGATVDNVQIRDMTIDANGAALVAANSSDYKTEAIHLKGANCVVSNVHAIGAYGNFIGGDDESFVISIESTGNALIEDCTVDNFAAGNDYTNAIAFLGGTGGTAVNCLVKDNTTQTAAYVGYGANMSFINCHAVNCYTFMYMDTGNASNLLLRGCQAFGLTNQFLQLAQAGGYSHHDVVVDGCFVDFSADGGTFFSGGPADSTHLYNITLSNNTAISSTGKYFVPYAFTKIDNFSEHGNNWTGDARLMGFDWATSTGANYNSRFQSASQNTNSSLAGSVKITGNFSAGGYLYYRFDPSNYTLASGDHLKFEILSAESNASHRPTAFVYFTDTTQTNPLRDQNGINIQDDSGSDRYAEIGPFSRGRWYARDFDLTAYAGKTADYFECGWDANLDSAISGVHTFWIRNIRIVDKNGLLKKSYYTDGDAAPALVLNSAVASYSGAPTPLTIAEGGTNAATVSGARSSLGFNSEDRAASSESSGDRVYSYASYAIWDSANGAVKLTINDNQFVSGALHVNDLTNLADWRTALGLTIGANVQAYDADLTTWAGVTPGTGVAAALAVNVGSSGSFVRRVTAPAAANSTGVAGNWSADTDFIYICTATDTWKRVAIATWP